ncbi:MAG: Rieske (2Fe-2S) protein [Rhodospirillaceae bacterium]
METDLQDGGRKALSRPAYLCRVDEIADPGSKGFEKIGDEAPFFVVRRGDEIYAYRNSCPHYGVPLDWKPDAFLSYDRKFILCSMHAALFAIEDGKCMDGPCPGEFLEKVNINIENGIIYRV